MGASATAPCKLQFAVVASLSVALMVVPGYGSAGPLVDVYYFDNTTGGPVNDLHVSFSGTQGTIANRNVVQQPAGAGCAANNVANSAVVDIACAAAVGAGQRLGFTFEVNTDPNGVSYIPAQTNWTNNGANAGAATRVEPATFVAPTVAGPATITSTAPTTTWIRNGLVVTGLQYELVATGNTPVTINPWAATRPIVWPGPAAPPPPLTNARVQIFGNTAATFVGALNLVEYGIVDNIIASQATYSFNDTVPLGGSLTFLLDWNELGPVIALAGGPHNLTVGASGVWIPRAVGDRLTITSEYDVQLAVPEPSGLLLVFASLAALGFIGWARGKSAH